MDHGKGLHNHAQANGNNAKEDADSRIEEDKTSWVQEEKKLDSINPVTSTSPPHTEVEAKVSQRKVSWIYNII